MSWFCNTKEAIEHKKNCKKNPWNCGKCVWIDESAIAMGRYGKVVEKEREPEELHPLFNEIIDKFNGRLIDE
tara:strand:- start:200 stop:415 length:216 start_codon:yes stop_codon:yes gene_type:complete